MTAFHAPSASTAFRGLDPRAGARCRRLPRRRGIGAGARRRSAGPRRARLSDIDGQVWLYSPDAGEWISVERNRPLTTGDRIATDTGARAELSIGSTTLRLDRTPSSRSCASTTARSALRLHDGSVAARLRNPQSLGEFELVTDEGRFRVQRAGRYRFDRFDQASDVTVFNGQAQLRGPQPALPVTAGQRARVLARRPAACRSTRSSQPVRDAFAGWNDDRDRAEDRRVRRRAALRLARDDRRRRPRSLRPAGSRRPEYGAALGAARRWSADWAPYTHRPLGLGAALGLDLGRRRAVGLRAVPLRSLGLLTAMSGAGRPAPTSLARSTRRRWSRGSAARAAASRSRSAAARRRRLVPARAARGLRAVVPRQPALRAAGQRHARHQRHQHHDDVNNNNGEADRRDFANRKYPHAVTFVPTR